MKIKSVCLYDNSSEESKKIREKLEKEFSHLGIRVEDKDYQLAIAIGGDGTFLKMISFHQFHSSLIYTGINLGRIGMLQEIEESDMDLFFNSLKNDSYLIKKVPLLEINVTTGKNRVKYYCLNEVVIREDGLRTTTFDIFTSQSKLETFVGDGVLVSSSIGSSAYNASLGGSIILSDMNTMQLTPLAPVRANLHHHFFNSLIFSEREILKIYPKGRSNHLILSLDGNSIRIEAVEEIEIKISDKQIQKLVLSDDKISKFRKKLID